MQLVSFGKVGGGALSPIFAANQPGHPLKRLKIIGDKQTIAIAAAKFLLPPSRS